MRDEPTSRAISWIGTRVLAGIGIAFYVAILTSGRWQATLGKRVCGIHVVNADGSKLSLGSALGRHFAVLLSQFTLGIGYVMAAFTDQKRSLHDMICNTRVVHGRQ